MSNSTISVCQGMDCGKKLSKFLVMDIEELVAGRCNVDKSSCLDQCGKGPNINVIHNGKETIVNGIGNFKKLEQLVKQTGVKPSSAQSQVAALKFEIRRSNDEKDNMAKVEKALKVVGGEDKGATTEPRLTAELLVMRGQLRIEIDVKTAMEDAQRALELFPGFTCALHLVAMAHEKLGFFQEALDAINAAMENPGVVLDLKAAVPLQGRLDKKCKEINGAAAEEEKAAKAKAEAEAKAKAEAEAKQKAEEQAKKKAAAAAKKKAEAEAKKKKEAEAKKKAEVAKKKAEAEAKAKAEQEEAEAKAKAEEEEKLKAEAEAAALAEAGAKAAAEAEEAKAAADTEEAKKEEGGGEVPPAEKAEQQGANDDASTAPPDSVAPAEPKDIESLEPPSALVQGAPEPSGAWWSCCVANVNTNDSDAAVEPTPVA